MQTTEHIHPGGKPALAKPQPLDDKVRHHGDINFHRLIPKSRRKSKVEDDASTTENIEVQEKDETEEEVVEGRLYAWASNICHLEDTKVKVEDLSDREIDSRLAQNTQGLLSKILKCDAAEMQVGAYFRSKQHEGQTTEEFTIQGPLGDWRVCCKTYHNIDARGGPNSQYRKSATAKRILAKAKARAGPAPSDAQVKHVACRILAKRHIDLADGIAEVKWPDLLREAHEILYNHRGDATLQSRMNEELSGATEGPATLTPELVDLVENNLLTGQKKKNKLHQFILDEEASTLREHVEGFDIVILRDGKHELICGVVAEAVQKLFPADTVDKMSTAVEAFAWRFPYKKPDESRHPTSQTVHLAANPSKDVRSEECQQPHFAVLLKSTAWKDEFPKLKGGVYGVAAKVSTLVLEAWDHKLYEAYLEIRQHLPEELKMTLATTCENPYGYMAQLVDTLTEGHTDVKDWMQGMAALTCFGNFSGGDLVLKQLGVRIAFPSGSNCHLRGQGLHHFISRYKGIRHSLVLTNKESVRRTIDDLDQRLKEETERAAWTDEEHELDKAYTEGKDAMRERTWSLIKAELQEKEDEAREELAAKRKEADNSKEDHPEDLPKKKAKKSKTAQ
ncbi:hypothetical protein INS49_005073 [Diaporthe citri]|uniref:uncharacterized protein n=1 Tax=Diaporthe citri TaxID=83186 RepID=UPI001C7EC11E|nr:uncharacterized protein INS49_005073 [Diaporthe citri]KAG6354102.1 hypothetical protein INS49_005073 [Diaporthe citri]